MAVNGLGEALYREITNGRSPHTEVTTLGQALGAIVGRAGSVSAGARELGVSRSTLRGWLAGRTPRGGSSWVVDEARRLQRRQRLPRGREKRLRAPGAMENIKIVGGLTYGSTPEPDRDLDIGPYLDDIQNELIDAYLAGASLDELADIFCDGVDDGGFYSQTFDPDGELGWDVTDLDGWA